jgi:hypothetical protein
LAERLSLEILQDDVSSAPDRSFAWLVLETLAPRTSPDLEDFLLQSARHSTQLNINMALLNLSHRSLDDRCLALCRIQCREGNSLGFDILSEVADPTSTALLEEMTCWPKNRDYPINEIPYRAQNALERINILKSIDYESRLRNIILSKDKSKDPGDLRWAIRVAQRRGMTSLKSVLWERLYACREPWELIPNRLPVMLNPNEDRLLVAYAQEGGVVLPKEAEFLADAGFIGNSEERLLEIVAQWKTSSPEK